MRPTTKKILEATIHLAQCLPHDKITFSDVAKEAGVHRSTVQRYFGSKEEMRKMLREQQVKQNYALPDTKTRILASARDVFAKRGFQGASLDLVAKEAGLTKGAVYWHFSSKNDLYLALCEQSLQQLLRGLPEQVQAVFDSSNVLATLRDFFASQLASCEREGNEQTLLFFEFIASSRDDSVKEKLCQSFSTLFDETSKILLDLQKKGKITTDIDAHDLSIALHSFVNGVILMWLVAPNHVSFQSISDAMSKMILEGIKQTSSTNVTRE